MRKTPIRVIMKTYTKSDKKTPDNIQLWAQYARKLSLVWESGYYN